MFSCQKLSPLQGGDSLPFEVNVFFTMYTHTHTHTHTHTDIHIHTHIYISASLTLSFLPLTTPNSHTYSSLSRQRLCCWHMTQHRLNIYHARMYVCMYVWLCSHTQTHTHTPTHNVHFMFYVCMPIYTNVMCVCVCVCVCTGRGSDAGSRLSPSSGNQRNFSNILYLATLHRKHNRALTFEKFPTS